MIFAIWQELLSVIPILMLMKTMITNAMFTRRTLMVRQMLMRERTKIFLPILDIIHALTGGCIQSAMQIALIQPVLPFVLTSITRN